MEKARKDERVKITVSDTETFKNIRWQERKRILDIIRTELPSVLYNQLLKQIEGLK